MLAGRRAEALRATADAAYQHGGKVIVVPTDVSKPASVKALFNCVGEVFGRLDVLFNNAGTGGARCRWKT